MNWLEYFLQFISPAFAIYLVLVSGLTEKLVTNRVRLFVSANKDEELKKKAKLIEYLVVGGAMQASILNTVFAALVSVLVIAYRKVHVAVITVLVILILYIPVILIVLRVQPDYLAHRRFSWVPINYSTVFKLVMVTLNLILCIAIWWSLRSDNLQSLRYN